MFPRLTRHCRYDGASYDALNNKWTDKTGNGNTATATGAVAIATGGFANPLAAATQYLSGGTSSYITFPAGVLPQQYSLFHVARYVGTNRQVRQFKCRTGSPCTYRWEPCTDRPCHGVAWYVCCCRMLFYLCSGVQRVMCSGLDGSPGWWVTCTARATG